ncbi:hypothetical protein AB0M20_37575 [Actinoplanes sp. NPDC051633]|uniref:hypothetical protein n=1 Tax=Actinoplanes sp. NPDC051633 TaxID=3155670 RepID=UPI0034333218
MIAWRIAAAGAVVAAAGIAILKAGGGAMPLVPPGALLLLAAAVLVIIVRSRWSGLAPVLVGLAEAAGILASGGLDTLTGDQPWQAVGTAVRILGVTIAVVAGVGVLRGSHRGSARVARQL